MLRFLLYLFLMCSLLVADNLSPTFIPIEPAEDFYAGSDIYIEVQVMDQSDLTDVNLFYRFSRFNRMDLRV